MSSEAHGAVAPSSGVRRPAFSAHPGGAAAFGTRAGGVALLALLVLTGCGESGSDQLGTDAPRLECEREGYPCTWGEVSEAIRERTHRIGEVASLLLEGGATLEEVASFIDRQAGVAESEIFGDQVRFRLEDGRPGRIVPSDVLDHHWSDAHPIPPLDSTLGPGAPDDALPNRDPSVGAGRHIRDDTWDSRLLDPRRIFHPAPLHAATPPAQSSRHGIAAREPGKGKRALVVSPYEYDWPGTGAGAAERASLIKDYRKEHKGKVIYHADLRDIDDNPEDPGAIQRGVGAEPLLSGQVEFDDFLHWDQYNMVILVSHGAPDANCLYHPSGECPAIWAGRPKRESYDGYDGVDVMYMPVRRRGEERPPDPDTRYPRPRQRGEEWVPLPPGEALHPGLTPGEASTCMRLIDEGRDDPTTSSGKPCTYPTWEHERPRLLLTYEFFLKRYGSGLNNVFLFLWACSSGLNDMLLELFAPEGNENVTVLGWTSTVDGGVGTKVLHRSIELIGEPAWDSDKLMEELKKIDTGGVLTGRSMAPDEPPDADAEVVENSANPTHARDVVELRHPDAGRELEKGDTVRVVGMSGDGKPDSLDVRATVVGVSEPSSLEQVRLRVSVVGGPKPEEGVVPRAFTDQEGAYEHDGPVPLGRDVREGEVVDLEIEGELPGGGLTRWRYEDIHLASFSWTLTVSGGPAAGTYRGGPAVASIDRAGRITHVGLYTGTEVRPDVHVLVSVLEDAGYEPGVPARRGTFEVILNYGDPERVHLDVDSFKAERIGLSTVWPHYPPMVEIQRVTEETVEGFAEGAFSEQKTLDQAGTMRVEFRARACRVGDPDFSACTSLQPVSW